VVRVFVVYDTKYGNTKLVAEKIVEGLKEVEGIEAAISDVEGVDLDEVAGSDAVLIGSPNHVGRPARSITRFIDKLGKLGLKGKHVAVFDTYLAADFEKATKKMEQRIKEKAPSLKIIAPGLSIRVEGSEGPVAEGELPKSKEFGTRIAAQLTK